MATLNAFGLREAWPSRREVMATGFSRVQPDLVAMQEVVVTEPYDQGRDVLGGDYQVVHHRLREADGQGISIVNHLPDWQLDHEVERERQTGLVSDAIEQAIATHRFRHVLLAAIWMLRRTRPPCASGRANSRWPGSAWGAIDAETS